MNIATLISHTFLLGTFVCQVPTAGPGTAPSTPSLTSAKLLEDVDVLKQVYESAHPGLYRYNTKAQMDRHFTALRSEFARDRTLADSYIAFSQFLAKVKCGHTYANFFNQPKEVVQSLFSGRNRVPFCFRWIGGRMIVTRDLSRDPRLRPGSEILSIDGIQVRDILDRLMTITRADGSNDAKRIAYLEVLGTGKYEAFDIFLPLFFPTISERMELLMRETPTAAPITVVVAAQDLVERKELARANKEPQRGEAETLWRFESLDDRRQSAGDQWRRLLLRDIAELQGRGRPAPCRQLRRSRATHRS